MKKKHLSSPEQPLPVLSEGSEEDDESSLEGGTETSTGKAEDTSDNGSVNQLGQKETRLVNRSKILVFLVLCLSAAGCAFGTYRFTANADSAIFKSDFEDYATGITETSQTTAAQIFSTIYAMSLTVTSYALSVNETWPYVTVNHFEQRGQQLLDLSSSKYVALSPFVPIDDVPSWEEWSVKNQGWIPPEAYPPFVPPGISPKVFRSWPLFEPATHISPTWQLSPVIPFVVNQDTFNPRDYKKMAQTRKVVLSEIISSNENVTDMSQWPTGILVAPIFQDFSENSELVAQFTSIFPWHNLFTGVLPEGIHGIFVILENTCNQTITYRIDGPTVKYLGDGDLHDSSYDDLEFSSSFDVVDDTCAYKLRVYPSETMEQQYETNNPLIYTAVVLFVFGVTSAVFVIYDWLVQRRQDTVMTSATRSNAIVSNLFPAQFRDRLMEDQQQNDRDAGTGKTNSMEALRVPSPAEPGRLNIHSKPIADLFLSCTVMFADISGFTAWSSTREPSQVFTLLEQIYSSFDAIAKRRRVFKVETIGDCYVAAAGVPVARADHATVMARFASECRVRVNRVVKELEVLLGPDTSELTMRFGLHSGPVTAGVLRGEKCRFQLFGDTVNTASRIQETGDGNMIHISSTTAELLEKADKSEWITPRKTLVTTKGKGEVKTYWLTVKQQKRNKNSAQWETESDASDITSMSNSAALSMTGSTEDIANATSTEGKRNQRLVEWNTEVLQSQLKKIIAMRHGTYAKASTSPPTIKTVQGQTVLQEVMEVIPLSNKANDYKLNPELVLLDPGVVEQLRDFVANIATMYRDNAFHSFEHASHVNQSVTKLLARIVTHESIDYNQLEYKQMQQREGGELHKYTFGITSDPLIQFALCISALIHDVDHSGVPNAQLVKEETEIAKFYGYKSVAEQNSVDLAWGLLMEPTYQELRDCICPTQEEMNRFRHLVVNSVMATDIVDKELGALRKKRWNKAFHIGEEYANVVDDAPSRDVDTIMTTPEQEEEDVNRKATIVIEHLIQASDVSHTMQHWHIYLKWNERFFQECYGAYLAGRASVDPSLGWYQGELGFFDFYLIPLAKKLKDCGVFGVSSDEYLNYALANRSEWESKGEEIVQGYLAKYGKTNDDNEA